MDPITIAMVIGATTKGIGGMIDAERQKAFQEAVTEAKLQYLDDQILEQKLSKAREKEVIEGTGLVKSGAQGVQFTGSVAQATSQAVFERELQGLRKIRDAQYERSLTSLSGQATQSQLTGSQIGSGIGIGGDLIKIAEQDKTKDTINQIKEAK